jgi:hypothetical protein
MIKIRRPEVIMPGGIELTLEAERFLDVQRDTRMLSVGCGTGELELYLAEKYGCTVEGGGAASGRTADLCGGPLWVRCRMRPRWRGSAGSRTGRSAGHWHQEFAWFAESQNLAMMGIYSHIGGHR